MPESSRRTGHVAWFSVAKGYGFIDPDGGGESVFVRHGDIVMDGFKSLDQGQKVSFVEDSDDHGPIATDVHVT